MEEDKTTPEEETKEETKEEGADVESTEKPSEE